MTSMKNILQSTILISAALCIFTLAAPATEIRMGSHQYIFGITAAGLKDREVFIISENSLAHPRLVLKPKSAPLALRTSEVQAVANIKTIAEMGTEDNSSAKQTAVTGATGQSSFDHMCLLPVYFRFDQSELADFEKDQLDRLVSWVKGDSVRESSKVRVTGYTCDLGSRDYNDRLSLLRAKSVAAYLESKGLKPLDVRGEGKNKPLSEVRSLNRRVEIDIIR